MEVSEEKLKQREFATTQPVIDRFCSNVVSECIVCPWRLRKCWVCSMLRYGPRN